MIIDFINSGIIEVNSVSNTDFLGMGMLYDGFTHKIIDIESTKDLKLEDLHLSFSEHFIKLDSITADTVDIEFVDLQCKIIKADDVTFDNCYLRIDKIIAKNTVQISDEDGPSMHIGEIETKRASFYSSLSTKIVAKECYISNNDVDMEGVFRIKSGSDIRLLECDSYRIELDDNVTIGEITRGRNNENNYDFWPFRSIGKNVTFTELDWTNSDLEELPQGLTVKNTLIFDITNIPEEIGSNIVSDRVIITDEKSRYPAKDYQYNLLKKLLESIKTNEIILDGTLVYDKLQEIAPQLKIRKAV